MASRGLWATLFVAIWLVAGCQPDPDDTAATDPCDAVSCGAGTCVADGDDAVCDCPLGWAGADCSVSDGCFASPCGNGGTCGDDGAGGYTCDCAEGWSGTNCAVSDGCHDDPCANGGTCDDDGAGGHTCDCVGGWAGADCATSDGCHDNPCANDGACADDGAGGYTCDCAEGWTGTECATSDGCHGDPCANGGTCGDDGAGGHTCECAPGWSGADCIASDGCHDDPCANGGTCNDDSAGGYTCDCAAGWAGPECATSDGCHDDPCANGGACADDGAGSFTCDCEPGWTGLDCATSDGCHADPCLNDGACNDDGAGGYTCDCTGGWTGTDCDADLDECSIANGGCGDDRVYDCIDPAPGDATGCVPLASSCNEIVFLAPEAPSGDYTIDLDGQLFDVTCDMDLQPGVGLTLVAHNDGAGLTEAGALGAPGDARFKLATSEINALQVGSVAWVIEGDASGWTASLATSADLPVYDTIDPSSFVPNTWDNLQHALLSNGSVVSGCGPHQFDDASWFADVDAAAPRCWAYPTTSSFFDYTSCATVNCGQGTGAAIYLLGAVYALPRSCAEVPDHDPQGGSGTYEVDPDGWGFGVDPFFVACGEPGVVRRDCAAFLDADPQAISGVYAIDAGLGTAFEAACEFDLVAGFGLTLVAANDFPLDAFPAGYDPALVPSLEDPDAIGTPYDQDQHKLSTETIDTLRGGSAFWFVEGALSGLTAALTIDLPMYSTDLANPNEYDSLPTVNLGRGLTGCGSDRWADGDWFVVGDPVPSPSCFAYPVGSGFYDFHSTATSHPTGPQRIFVGRPAGLDLPVSCADALSREPQSQTGLYELDPDGSIGALAPFDAWCDMTTDGGGWTLVAKMSSSSSSWAYAASRWTSIGGLFGDDLTAPPSLTTGEAKYAAFDHVRLDEVRIVAAAGEVVVPAPGRSLRQASALASLNTTALPDRYDDVVGFLPGNDSLAICTSVRTAVSPRDNFYVHGHSTYINGAYARARLGYAVNGSNSHIWAQTASCAMGLGLEAYGPGGTFTAGTSVDGGFATVWVRDGALPRTCAEDPTGGGDLARSIVDPDGYGGETATTDICDGECQSVMFDGVNDYAQMSATTTGTALGTGPWTVEGWIRLDAAPSGATGQEYAMIVAPTCQFWSVYANPDQTLSYSRWPNGCNGTTPLALGEWHHFAGTGERGAGTPYQLYVDGQLECSGTSTQAMHGNLDGEWIQLGTRSDLCLSESNTPNQARWFYEGAIKGLRFSDTVRYTAAFTPPTQFAVDASTRMLWDFEEGSGTNLNDRAGVSHDAQIVGATWDPDGPACVGP